MKSSYGEYKTVVRRGVERASESVPTLFWNVAVHKHGHSKIERAIKL